jgi:hypothetical protein
MREEVLTALSRTQITIRREWEQRLRERPIVSALALPDLMIRLMDWTLDSIWTDVRTGGLAALREIDWPTHCACNANPLTGYFLCAKDTFIALFETTDIELPPMSPGEKNLCAIELMRALDRVAAKEIQTFCALCQQRPYSSESTSVGTSNVQNAGFPAQHPNCVAKVPL